MGKPPEKRFEPLERYRRYQGVREEWRRDDSSGGPYSFDQRPFGGCQRRDPEWNQGDRLGRDGHGRQRDTRPSAPLRILWDRPGTGRPPSSPSPGEKNNIEGTGPPSRTKLSTHPIGEFLARQGHRVQERADGTGV